MAARRDPWRVKTGARRRTHRCLTQWIEQHRAELDANWEPGPRALFVRCHRDKATRLISVLNFSEVLVAPSADQARLRAAREAIAALGVTVHRPSEAIAVDAARLRLEHPIGPADAYCLATTRFAQAQLVSFDRKVVRAAKAEQIASV